MCRALVATGIAEYDGDRLRLTPAWRGLTDPGAYVPLDVALDGNAVTGRLPENATGATYWSMPAGDRLTYARAVSPGAC